ncbi:MAG: class I SAM-dependent methyltransferase [Clostridia bacterium]|nr:class I SAM-dependent methyltransferase [Deltaproteobacteria bacterium]
MTEPLIHHVSETALWVASYRAEETERPDALFHDPLAGVLAGERGRQIAAEMQGSRMTGYSVVIRTCIIDELLRERLADGADLVLNLGAGLDTRPYRLELPKELIWIEVDYPHMLAMKEEKLAAETPRCDLRRTAVDLSDKNARESFIASTAKLGNNIVVLTEGVIPYLSPGEVTTLANDLRKYPNYRFWILDYYARSVHRYLRNPKRVKQMGDSAFKFFVDDWHAFFANLGWRAKEVRYYILEGRKLGRSLPVPWFIKLAIRFTSKKKRVKGSMSSGYALLERP